MLTELGLGLQGFSKFEICYSNSNQANEGIERESRESGENFPRKNCEGLERENVKVEISQSEKERERERAQ